MNITLTPELASANLLTHISQHTLVKHAFQSQNESTS